jgi:hypothetical protein
MNPMTEAEVQDFLRQSNWFMRGLIDQNKKDFQLDSFSRFDWDQWRGELLFSTGGDPKVLARIQVAGTHSTKSNAWQWAWSNSNLLEPVRRASLKAKQFGEERSIIRLIQPRWAAKDSDCWEMTGVVTKLNDAKGAFRCPGPEGFTYLVITDIRAATDRKRIFPAQTCTHVLEEGQPILLVSRELNGDVVALCGGDNDTPATTKVITLSKLLDLDTTLSALAEMPDGWVALRESEGDDWVRSKAE